MEKIYSFIPKKTLVLVVVLLTVIISLTLILSLNPSMQDAITPLPVISQSPSSISPLQKSVIGKTTKADFVSSYPDLREQFLANGDSKYSLPSTMTSRPNEVVFRTNLAEFERTILVSDQRNTNYLKLSDQVLKYGPAEKVARGSKFYGYKAEAHIWASKGIAFIVNPFADEIYEIQTFSPTSVENYLSNYGQDISYTEGIEVKE